MNAAARAIIACLPVFLARRIVAWYAGAQYRTGSAWLPGAVQSARFDATTGTREELVRKARYFEANNGLFNRLADVWELYTVGGGLVSMPATKDPKWNADCKAWFDEWSEAPDPTSRLSLGALEGVASRGWFVNGEAFFKLLKGASPGVQLLESHRVASPEGADPKAVIDGIQVDPLGRPIGYWIFEEDSNNNRTWGELTPAEQIVHLWEPARAGQYRGLPYVTPVINALDDLDQIQALEMQCAKNSADIANVVKTETGELTPEQMLAGTTNTQAGSADKKTYYKNSFGGRTIVLEQGDTAEQFKVERPSANTREHWRLVAENICAGTGIAYVLAYPESMQGTVYRGALDCAAAFFRQRFQVAAQAHRAIYRHAIGAAKAGPLRPAPPDWKAVTIHAPRAVNVDVGRNSTALLQEIAAGASNYGLHYASLGLDWREQFDALAEQRAYAEKRGLKLAFPGAPSEIGDEPEADDDSPPSKTSAK